MTARTTEAGRHPARRRVIAVLVVPMDAAIAASREGTATARRPPVLECRTPLPS